MARKSVASSNIKSIGHDTNSNTLEVEFNNGSVYKYSGVPASEYERFSNATSKGTHLNQHIKNKYPTYRSQ